jgi:hypothetical protein
MVVDLSMLDVMPAIGKPSGGEIVFPGFLASS